MKLGQIQSIFHYIVDKHSFLGMDLKEKTPIDMHMEGTLDLLELIIFYPFLKLDDH